MSTPETSPRQRLVERAVAVMTERGSTGWSLRSLAEALGTSHRMLSYHFGSLDGVLLAVVEHVDEAARARFAALSAAYDDPMEAARAWWQALADPAEAAGERLFFELYAAALQGRTHARPLLEGAVTEWLAGPADRGLRRPHRRRGAGRTGRPARGRRDPWTAARSARDR